MMWPDQWSWAFSSISFDVGSISLVQDFGIGDFVLPLDTQDGMECSHMELFQLPDVMNVDGPGLTAMEQ